MIWTDERIRMIRDGARRGLSFSEVAHEIGNGCNRNMVAGKAFRERVRFVESFEKMSAKGKRNMAIRWGRAVA